MSKRNIPGVAQAWKNGEFLRAGNIFSDGGTIYSYGWHAIGITQADGTKVGFCCHYSKSTQRHSSAVKAAADIVVACPSDHGRCARPTKMVYYKRKPPVEKVDCSLCHDGHDNRPWIREAALRGDGPVKEVTLEESGYKFLKFEDGRVESAILIGPNADSKPEFWLMEYKTENGWNFYKNYGKGRPCYWLVINDVRYHFSFVSYVWQQEKLLKEAC